MKIKSKKCKGTGQAKGYGCNKPTLHRIYGLGKMCCYADWLYNSDAGKAKLKKAITKVQKPRKEFEALKKETKNRESLTALINSVKIICHKYIRERDKNKPCISCNTPYKSDFDAGHFYSGGKFSSLKFNETNIHGQCIKCNRFNEGMHEEYRIGLINRFGNEFLIELDRKASVYNKNNYKWDREDLINIRKYYKLKIKEL